MKKRILGWTLMFCVMLLSSLTLSAQRKMETLDRGLIAVKTTDGVFVNWRIFGEEWYEATYNLYRDGNLVNATPLEVSNYKDAAGTVASEYTVKAVVNGVEQAASSVATPLSQQYLEINMVDRPNGYEVNDATAADLDGDGEFEIIVKRMISDWSAEATLFAYFEAYKLDGTLMWELNVGPNIMSSAGVEINIAAFDLDEDGKAEVFLRTSEGTIFGDGTKIGDVDGDGRTNYRYSVVQSPNMQYMNAGPEFLSLVDGETGVELDRVDFIPRGSSSDWGDSYGHRANKFFFGAPYLDGKKPSIFIGRGIYTKTIMRAYDVENKKLVSKWQFSTDNNPSYAYQGNHNYTIADVDEDGRDEIVWGGMTVDDDGTGLYTTQLGHGDALHVGDLDPFRKGIEVWRCLENSPMFGTSLNDGATGEILIHDVLGRDCGRCMGANISDHVQGATLWGSTTMFSATTKDPVNVQGNSVNFRIYWDGDLLEELIDHNWNGAGGEGVIQKSGYGNIFTASGTNSCNWTKGTPTLQADLFGDWREEVIWRTADDKKIRIYTTIDPTPYRNYTLMHDHQYRQAICWQMCGYNQPPHLSYFLGEREGFTVPAPPMISNGRAVYNGGGTWDTSSANWTKDDNASTYTDGDHVLFDVTNGEDVSLTLSETVEPSNVSVNSPGDYTIDASAGSLSGTMKMVKQGLGTFHLNGSHDFTGNTEVWTGRLALDGTLSNSAVWVNVFGELEAKGTLNKGVNVRYGSSIYVGGENAFGSLVIGDSLQLENNATLVFDLHSATDAANDTLTVNGDLILKNGTIIKIIPHLANGESGLAPGSYKIAKVSGDIEMNVDQIKIQGILGTPASLEVQDGNLVLEIKDMRDASSVVWNGSNSNVWDLANTSNFLNNGTEDVFVTGDDVTITDDAIEKSIVISEDVTPIAVTVNNTEAIAISGQGSISGDATLTKSGTGKLTLSNNNSLTGKVEVNGGTLSVKSLPNTIDEGSPIGPVTSNGNLFEINGGKLDVTAETTMDRAMRIGNSGGTINNSNTLNWNGKISGNKLTKEGSGELVLGSANSISQLLIKQGTVRLYNEEAHPGNTVTFEGGALACYDNSYTYSNSNVSFVVPEGKTGMVYLDGRCAYTGSLTGAGRLNVYTPFVRSDMKGDWSAFSGMINITAPSGGGDFRVYNRYGYTNSTVVVGSNVNFYVESSGGASSMEIGALILYGTGSFNATSGYFTWVIGGNNENSLIYGTVSESGTTGIEKVGTGDMTLKGANAYKRYTHINGGSVICSNTSGSATGTGPVSINETGVLKGKGSCSGIVSVNNGGLLTGTLTLNKVNVFSGGTVSPGGDLIGEMTMKSNLTFRTDAILMVDVSTNKQISDVLNVTGTVTLAGELVVDNDGNTPYQAGDKFQIFNASSVTGTFDKVTPSKPADGLMWDFSDIENGYLQVAVETAVDDVWTNAISVSPNPTEGSFVISLEDVSNTVTYSITDLQGRIIKSGSMIASQQTINIEGEPTGVYLIQLTEGDKKTTKRIMLL